MQEDGDCSALFFCLKIFKQIPNQRACVGTEDRRVRDGSINSLAEVIEIGKLFGVPRQKRAGGIPRQPLFDDLEGHIQKGEIGVLADFPDVLLPQDAPAAETKED